VTQVADSVNGTITRGYDNFDRLTSETTPLGSISYTYDADGRRATMTVAGQTLVTYGYDDSHRLTSITQGTAVVSITYDNADRRSTITYPNGILATYSYDNANQLTSLAYTLNGNAVGDLTYTYDLAGRRISVGGAWARTGLPQPLTSATYDAANRLITWGSQVLSYDANGNIATDGPTSYVWNARNQLAGMSGGTTANFAYDGLTRRRSRTIGGTTTNFLYDGENLVQELASGGAPTASLLTGLGIDETFTRTDAGGIRTLLIDALTSTLALADASGTVQTQYAFEPFGATTASGGTSTNPGQFTGRENDLDGLYFYRARYLAVGSGRFLSEDPIDFEDGSNRYSYVLDDPMDLIDPSGLWPESLDYTVRFWKDFYHGSKDMYENYRKMTDANTKGVDKWFHCMANCQASQRGPGGLLAAQVISELREDYGYWKGDPPGDSLEDLRANRCGRRGDPKCDNRCNQYLPPWFNPPR
jgi:RHS repeat-associated protein